MSESAPEATPRSGGNIFTRKLGPLPMWGWMAIAALLAVFYYLYAKNKSASSTTAASAQTTATNNTPGGVDSSLVPQFINQEYVNTTPTPAPSVTVNNTVPATTAPAPAASTTSTSSTAYEYSWTDTGQSWTVGQLASKLGISVSALKGANTEGVQALTNSSKPIGKGAKFTYVKEPKGVTTTTTKAAS